MTTIESWDADVFEARVDEVMGIYVAAMNYPPFAGAARGRAARGQATFPSFAARAAVDDDGRVIGFAYGYTSEDGQWWHDLVRRAVPHPLADTWLQDSFELSELHVLPEQQGRGLGQTLLLSLADGLPHRRMLLSTPDDDTRAFRLYRRLGFLDLARNHYFPGENRPFAVLGAELPLRVHAGGTPGG